MTREGKARIENADKVLYLMDNLVSIAALRKMNPSAESLNDCYELGKDRLLIYEAMVDRIMTSVRAGLRVCVVDYGHPGIFVHPAHRAIDIAKQEGYPAEMLPGISALDCLFADLGIDPGPRGCQIYDATYFLLRKRQVDVTCPLILLQISVTGILDHRNTTDRKGGVSELAAALVRSYGPDHEVTIYAAAQYPFTIADIQRVPLHSLPEARICDASTLFVPAAAKAELDLSMAEKLGIARPSRAAAAR